MFAEYAEDFDFAKTRVVVKLFTLGARFVSRSEARRVLANLEKWQTVVLSGARAHPSIELEPVAMTEPVAFLVKRAQGRVVFCSRYSRSFGSRPSSRSTPSRNTMG